ncbi:hypothetical protein [Qipengyuania sediminis]|uniref:hypothetical protein n=1 Tax=Qipengyuania sediminis TaxID=1532023 RepID=UPI0010593CB1|nr:hypothetical protein [Qipengyuania sediminis]
MAALANQPHDFISAATVGVVLAGGPEESALYDLLVPGEVAVLATGGDRGSALFTSHRVLVAERVGIISRRMAVKAFRRDAITAYSVDVDTLVTITLLGGSFGQAVLVFDEGFDPMKLSAWLGETLTGTPPTA